MSRTMFDAVTWQNIPDNAQMVAGYVSGRYSWPAEAWAKFAGRPHVRISCRAEWRVGNCLDVEDGDGTPEECPDWVINARSRGEDPTIYMNRSTWPAVQSAFRQRAVTEPHYWVAQWDDIAQPLSGAVAKQYRAAGIYDVSVCADYWPGVDNAYPVSNVQGINSGNITLINRLKNGDDDVALALLVRSQGTGVDPSGAGAIYLAEGSRAPNGQFVPIRKYHVDDPSDLKQYTDTGMAVEVCPGFLLDRAEKGPDIHTGLYTTEP